MSDDIECPVCGHWVRNGSWRKVGTYFEADYWRGQDMARVRLHKKIFDAPIGAEAEIRKQLTIASDPTEQRRRR